MKSLINELRDKQTNKHKQTNKQTNTQGSIRLK